MIGQCYLVEPFVCLDSDSVSDVGKKLRVYNQRHIYVVTKDMKPVGIISVSDILDKVVVEGKNAKMVKASEIMTHEILVFDDGEDARAAYKAMNEKGIVSCAVVQHAKMVGTLTLKEAVRFVTNPKNV